MEQAEKHLKIGLYESSLSTEAAAYVRYFSHLLGSPPHLLPQNRGTNGELRTASNDDLDNLDLLLYWEAKREWWQRVLRIYPVFRTLNRTVSSVLVVRQIRWPLRRILLILRADESDEAAIQWLRRLACPARATVFILPIVPPVPAMYRHGSLPLHTDITLATHTSSGARMRRLISLCATWNIQGELLLHNSEPQRRMEWAITTSNCDLIIISDEPERWILRQFFGELTRPLLHRANRPILIAKNTETHANRLFT